MTLAEARAYLKCNAKLAVETYHAWTEIGITLSVMELAESVALNIQCAQDCPTPMLGSDDFPF